MIIGIFFAAFDFDGDAHKNPEKMTFVFIFIYLVIGMFYGGFKESADCDESFFVNKEIPWLMRLVWFCYDIGFPSTVASIMIYYTLVPRSNIQNMTERVYIINMVLMGLDFVFGRMVLVPGHLLWYALCMLLPAVGYGIHFNATITQVIVSYFACLAWYVVLSNLTYKRGDFVAKCLKRDRDPFMLSYTLEDLVESDMDIIGVRKNTVVVAPEEGVKKTNTDLEEHGSFVMEPVIMMNR